MEDTKINPLKLTEEDKAYIAKTIEENKSENSKAMEEEMNKEREPETGEFKTMQVAVNPETGEKYPISSEVDDTNEDNKSDAFSDDYQFDDINPEDSFDTKDPFDFDTFKKSAKENESFIGKFNLSDDGLLQLLDLVNAYRADSTKKIRYKDLPEEVQKHVFDYSASQGYYGYSTDAKTFRNMIAGMLIEEFSTNATIDRGIDDFNAEIEKIYKDTAEGLSPLIKDYLNEREKLLKDAYEKVEDPEKRKIVADSIDSVHDAYELKRLDNASKNVRKFDIQDPKRVYNDFLAKYKDSEKYNIYDINIAETVLKRHLKDDNIEGHTDDTARKFLIIFCKFCQNYKVENPVEHGFMYYAIYNIMLLDIYKNKEYEEFAPNFLKRIVEIAEG